MDTSIPQKINDIIRQRQEGLPGIREMESRLEQVQAAVHRLDDACMDARGDRKGPYAMLFAQHPEVADRLQTVTSRRFYDQLAKTQKSLRSLEDRFSRGRIHIAFVGRAGYGKSLLMQRISGLSGDVIPSAAGGDCTGAKSIITNVEGGEVYAHIEFYTRQEYVDIVNDHLKAIYGDACPVIHMVEEIAALPARLPERRGGAKGEALYQKLQNYLYHSDEVIPLLDTPGGSRDVPASEIEQYVAQHSCRDVEHPFFKYLGVRLADIRCSFPCSQCGKIVLVDTIGLGDNALDLREKMLNTISHDSDAVLLMDLPRPDDQRAHVDAVEIDILDSIIGCVTDSYTKKMLFWVLNKVSSGSGVNGKNVGIVRKELDAARYPIAGVLPVDCKNADDVERNLLDPLLGALTANVPDVDRILLEQAQVEFDQLYQAYHELVESISDAFTASISSEILMNFDEAIDKAYDRMTDRIKMLYWSEDNMEQRNMPSEELRRAVTERLSRVMSRRPKVEDIRPLLDKGSKFQRDVYIDLTDKLRLDIINDFLGVNTVLDGLVTSHKRLIAHDMADDGRLGSLVSASPDDPDRWFAELEERLADDKDGHNLPIRDALRKMQEFRLRMEGYLIYPVRASLDAIDSSISGTPFEGSGPLNKDKAAKELAIRIEMGLDEVRQAISRNLVDLYSHPNMALWASVKDFYDRICRSVDGVWEAKRIWRRFYQRNVSRIWSEEFEKAQAVQGVHESWNSLVGDIQRYDDRKMFQLI